MHGLLTEFALNIPNKHVSHSMAKGIRNKTEKNQDQNYHSMKAWRPVSINIKIPLPFQTKTYLV